MTHICVSKLTVIGSDNDLSPARGQAIIWTNAGILLIRTLGTNFSDILIEILIFSFKKMCLKVSTGKRRPFCLGLNVLSMVWIFGCNLILLSGNATTCKCFAHSAHTRKSGILFRIRNEHSHYRVHMKCKTVCRENMFSYSKAVWPMYNSVSQTASWKAPIICLYYWFGFHGVSIYIIYSH